MLTEQQVQALFKFTERKYVRYYDVQAELVDHLAERITEERAINTGLSFEQALEKVYAGFGLFGFAHIVQEKERQVMRMNNRMWWQAVKSFFTLPRVVFTLCLCLVTYSLSGLIPVSYLSCVFSVTWLVYLVVASRFLVKCNREVKRPLMLLPGTLGSGLGLLPAWQFYIIVYADFQSRIWFTLMVVLATIMEVACLEVFKSIRQKAQNLYPEAFVSA